ncbi:hypothetical protein HN51_020879 [Arachis hypogaea]|uniref:Myeloid leukemia factor n=1 Tax=Arachis hypogaea TaxID=3818 RepID=A0A445EIU2_ARAHY|nr:uncharacterized protein LOC112730604 [Arachis hypogaea]QHO51728.1 uncharacterized protein DS421_2g33410 [Arachis hypogaea]RYR75379.1 hypothetical protein Ahy_A02g010029 [Arachis hypogaea]
MNRRGGGGFGGGAGGGRDPFFDFGGDPFGGGFGGGFGPFGPPGSLISSFFGGRDPFDDPFFRSPFGGGMFGSSPFGAAPAGFPRFPFSQDMHPAGFLDQHQAQAPAPESRAQRGPIIEELKSDDDDDDDESGEVKDGNKAKKENPRKHGRSSSEPFIEHPNGGIEGKKSRHLQARNEYNNEFNNRFNVARADPQTQSFCFQSSTVRYGGANGTYYTSSTTRRTGSDGVTFEEAKEADSSTREASHRVSRGIHGKGHSLSRKLNSDGRMDSMQTLHNLNEDELASFEDDWKQKGQKYLPEWTGNIGALDNQQTAQARQVGWALPSSELRHPARTMSEAQDRAGSSRTQERARIDSGERSASHPRGRGRN